MPSAWISHVKKVYAAGKSKGMKYSEAMKAAAKTFTKKGASKKGAAAADEPKKRRRRKKKTTKK